MGVNGILWSWPPYFFGSTLMKKIGVKKQGK